jgi:MFS family permease
MHQACVTTHYSRVAALLEHAACVWEWPAAAGPPAWSFGRLVVNVHRVVLAAALALMVAQGVGRFVLTPLLPEMQAETGLDDASAGLLGSLNFAGYLLGAVLVSFLPWLTLPRLIRLGLVLVIAGAVAMALGTSWALWSSARLIAGLGGAFLFLGAFGAAVITLNKAGAGALLGRMVAGVGCSIALGAVMALLVDPNWRLGWMIAAAFALAVTPMILRLDAGASQGQQRERLHLSGALWRVALVYGGAGFAFGSGATFFVRVFAASGPAHATLAWMAAGIVAAPSAPFWSLVGRRIGLGRALVASTLLLAAGVGLGGLSQAIGPAVLSGFLLGGTFMGISLLALDLARRIAPEAPARSGAFVTLVFGIGQTCGPLISGYLLASHGPLPAMLLPAAIAAASCLLMIGHERAGTGHG